MWHVSIVSTIIFVCTRHVTCFNRVNYYIFVLNMWHVSTVKNMAFLCTRHMTCFDCVNYDIFVLDIWHVSTVSTMVVLCTGHATGYRRHSSRVVHSMWLYTTCCFDGLEILHFRTTSFTFYFPFPRVLYLLCLQSAGLIFTAFLHKTRRGRPRW